MSSAQSTSDKSLWRYRAADHPSIVPVRAFSDNYIWVVALKDRTGARQSLVVDPGDAAPVLQALRAARLPLTGILITHHHADHTGGIAALKVAWPGAVVYGPKKCANPLIERRFSHGDRVEIPELAFACRVLEVPGHTLDHIAYYCERVGEDPRPVLFCGDTLFAAGCGRLFEGTPRDMFSSLARLTALPPQTLVYCAHEYTVTNLRFARAAEPDSDAVAARLDEAEVLRKRDVETVPSSLEAELATNPFLRANEAAVIRAVKNFMRLDASDQVAVFAGLRQWKNEFQG